MTGEWDSLYANVTEPAPYGDTITYKIGAEYLNECATVEDWGCGTAWMKQYVSGKYLGIDGSLSPYADVITDLRYYTSDCDGVFLRHVLEHNWHWRVILGNALKSARRRVVIVLFTPLASSDTQIGFNERIKVPDISLSRLDLLRMLSPYRCNVFMKQSATQYGLETIISVRTANA